MPLSNVIDRQAQMTALRPNKQNRSGAAVVELAILLPLLVVLFLMATDFARVFYFSLTLTNCARAGALYASDPIRASESSFGSARAAALADATNLSPSPTITEVIGVDASGRSYVEVTAAYTFNSIAAIPPIPNQLNLQRKVRMYVAASTPNTN
jgi:Flp pilus assembly protein TadG